MVIISHNIICKGDRMRKSIALSTTRGLVAAASALALLGVAACGTDSEEPAAESIVVTDATGTTVTLEGPAGRIACLTMICVDALKEVGITPVAYREDLALDDRFFGPDADMRKITGGFGEENVEDIAMSEPDLVIGLGGVQDGLRAAVEESAPLYLVDPSSWQDSVEFLRTVGQLTGKQAEADAAAQSFVERVETARQNRSDLTTLSMYGEPGSLGVDSVETPVGSLLAEVSDYPWPAGTDAFATVSVEQIAGVNPDVIFAQAFSSGDDAEPLSARLATNPIWPSIAAAQNNRVVEVEASLWATGRGTVSLGIVLDEVTDELAKS
ncbi:iron ABC transporter substrate-binding protein [Williamsia muralis]|uniref:Iron ABC transporter substrate-binding protein n=2 Tax=Williamsia marianensis TaxID=85044 RepID=A0A2G3PK59_WILMA|nr:iron ABC transporter substrate-binding protein [Williamsia marianensis]